MGKYASSDFYLYKVTLCLCCLHAGRFRKHKSCVTFWYCSYFVYLQVKVWVFYSVLWECLIGCSHFLTSISYCTSYFTILLFCSISVKASFEILVRVFRQGVSNTYQHLDSDCAIFLASPVKWSNVGFFLHSSDLYIRKYVSCSQSLSTPFCFLKCWC